MGKECPNPQPQVQWKMRSVENRKLWSITVTIAQSALLTREFSVPGRSYQMPWDPGGISKQSSSRSLKGLRGRQEWHPVTVRKQEAHLKELSQLDEQQKAAESSSAEGASGSNPEEATGSFSAGHPDLDRAGFPDAEGATTTQDVDHGGGSSNGRTSLAKREC
jgi:hypothetical protein